MLLPFMIAIFLKKKTLLKISGWWEMECGFLRPHGLLPKLMRKLLFKTQYMIAVSAEINLRLRLLGYPPDRILELPNGVDTSKFFCGHKNSGYVRLIFVGRLVTEKDLPTLLEAVSILVKTNSGLSLELVGDGREKSNLKKYVESMGIQKFVTFSGKKDNVAEALRNSDIFVQTSTTEGLPNALLEAMACGLPVVVTNVGGMPDVVKDNHNGFVIDSGNTLQLVERLQLLIHDPELRKKFSDNNLDLMRDNFSLDSVAAKYIEVYSN